MIEEETTTCPRCGQAFEPAQAQPELQGLKEVAASVQAVVKLACTQPSDRPVVGIQNIVKTLFNEIGDGIYGERGNRLLSFSEVQAATEHAISKKLSEKRSQGGTLRIADISELFAETDNQWREVVETKLEQFHDQVRQWVADAERAGLEMAALEVAVKERAARRAFEHLMFAREEVERLIPEAAERRKWPSNTQAAKTFRNIKAAIAEIKANNRANTKAGKRGGGS